MKRSYSKIKNILESLPIGFYTGRRIECELKEDAQSSYYAPLTDNIVISYPLIEAGLRNVTDDADYAEAGTRAMIYHEVSHAILTPKEQVSRIINIFEDERIETILGNFYYDTDFKENVYLLNNYTAMPETPISTEDEFYRLVRFRQGDSELVKEVDEIIYQFREMTATHYSLSGWYSFDDDMETTSINFYKYCDAVYSLYNKIAIKRNDKTKDWRRENWTSRFEENGNQFLDGDETNYLSEEDIEKIKGALTDNKSNLQGGKMAGIPTDQVKEQITSHLNAFYNPQLLESLRRIFENFNKKTLCGGAAVNSYSGSFNPRNAARKDYRYFIHKVDKSSNSQFGSFNLNLFVDDSGSMGANEVIVNQIIYALNLLEQENHNFTYNLATCADRIEVADKTKGYSARGGTHLSKRIIPLYRSLQKPNSYNYNIVLFDGYASTEKYLSGNTFGIFDNNNCTIISDYSNEKNLHKIHSAKIVLSNNYTDELIKNINQALQTALR